MVRASDLSGDTPMLRFLLAAAAPAALFAAPASAQLIVGSIRLGVVAL